MSMMTEPGTSFRRSQMSTGLVAMDNDDDVNELLADEIDEVDIYDPEEQETEDDLQKFLDGKISFKELARKMDEEDEIAPEGDEEEGDKGTGGGEEDMMRQKAKTKGRKKGRRSKLDEMGASLLGNAELYFARGKCEDAIAMVLQVVKDHPLAHELYQTLGDFYEQLAEDDKALQYYHIAAYLCPNDGDSWRTVADKHAEQGDFRTAVRCYEKAIRLIPLGRDQVDCRMERGRILEEEMRDLTKATQAYESVLNLCKDQDGDFATNLAKKLAKLHFENGNAGEAIRVLEQVFDKYESFIVSENVNMYIELLITEKLMVKALIACSHYCGVKILDSRSGNPISQSIDESSSLLATEDPSVIAVQLMFPMPIDLLSKLIVCLISLRAMHSVPELQKQIRESSVETTGDLYLDVAEAYIEAEMFSQAEPFLHELVESVSYGGEAAVWLRYARCLRQLQQDDRSITAYFHVLSLEPNHCDARLELSRLLLAHDRSAEAVEVSSQVGSSLVNLDLLFVRCKLLFEKKRFSEFVPAALTLLQSDMIYLKHDKEISCMITSTTHRTRLESLRDVQKELKITPSNLRQTFAGREPTSDEFFSVYVKLCHVLAHETKDFPELIRIALSAYTSHLLSEREKSLDFIALMALYIAQDMQYSYRLIKAIITRVGDMRHKFDPFSPSSPFLPFMSPSLLSLAAHAIITTDTFLPFIPVAL